MCSGRNFCYAQDEDKPYFKWNQSVGISLGYAWDKGVFGPSEMTSDYSMTHTDMLECDLNLYGFFFGMGFDLTLATRHTILITSTIHCTQSSLVPRLLLQSTETTGSSSRLTSAT